MAIDYKKRAYAWQEGCGLGGHKTMEISGSIKLTADACWLFKCVPPVVRVKKAKCGTVSRYDYTRHQIWLMWFHQNDLIVLHEAAHVVAIRLYGSYSHSKIWLAVFQWFLVYFKVFSKKCLKASMLAYKLPWIPLSPKSVT